MKLAILITFTFVAFTFAAPLDDSKDAQIINAESEQTLNGYRFSYETSDGISRSEEAEVKNQGTDNEILVVRGTVSWVAPDGVKYTISFISDENGFQPIGDHLPK